MRRRVKRPAALKRSYNLPLKDPILIKDPTVIILAGPTAVGKTAAAIRLAEQLSTRIISADSRQCFFELNIGVARPSPAELQAVPHYFIASHSVHEEVTAAVFEECSLGWAGEILSEKKVAVMVGGTGLYIKAFTEGLDEIPAIDPAIRAEVQRAYEEQGIAWLQEQIRQLDPAYFAEGEILNPQRLMRALEVWQATGQSILSFRTRQKKERPFSIMKIGLELPRQELYERINRRVDQMMEAGLLEEVKSLLPFRHLNALQTVGYKELFDHLDGKVSLEEAIELIKKNTRHYAKRQMTWFRKDPAIQWVDVREFNPMIILP
jgi:tRNA dimethylallyltransferase